MKAAADCRGFFMLVPTVVPAYSVTETGTS